ncbi:membrane protein of unknown function [Hyphomicrobium sp. 1Nfss2.1]|uniref:hypothetical protein n=1 Tax=Hyphomicrobium sp. 1Nfss2.1 TaxID=3413936 RepID=UPI003C7EB276
MLSVATRVIAVAGALFGAFMVLRQGDKSSIALVIIGVWFASLAAAPFVLPWRLAPTLSDHTLAGSVLLAATIAAASFSVAVYWNTFIDNANPDAQDGLVFLFVPIYQLIGLGLAYWLAATLATRSGLQRRR